MAYSTNGPKPFERASKSSHHHVINDDVVREAISGLHVPPSTKEESVAKRIVPFVPVEKSAIQHFIAVDGGYTEVPVRDGFPSACLHFFQFGALHFKREALKGLEKLMHVSPEDMQVLRNITRVKLALPTRGARRKDCNSLKDSVRFVLYDFLCKQSLGEQNSLMDTLAWFVFRRYKGNVRTAEERQWSIGSHPHGAEGGFVFDETKMSKDFKFSSGAEELYLSDVFRLHELIEEEAGAAGIVGYVAGIVEHLLLLHVVKNLASKAPHSLSTVLFIMDRPTGWFGVTALLHKAMIELSNWLFDRHGLFLAGLEKSGAFVEHAREIHDLIPAGSVVLLNDSYIYTHISPGQEDSKNPYAYTSYYGQKVIFKSRTGQMYVVSLPVRVLKKSPTAEDIPNLMEVLTHVEELHCDMYENALLPVALANKLVSLSAHPSTQILKSFAQANISS